MQKEKENVILCHEEQAHPKWNESWLYGKTYSIGALGQ